MPFLSHMGCRQTRRGGENGSEYSRYVKILIEIWAIYERNVKFKARSTSRKCPLRERCPFVGRRLMPRRDGVSVITVTVFRGLCSVGQGADIAKVEFIYVNIKTYYGR